MKLANINFVSLFLVFFSACLQSHGQVADIDSLLKKPQLKKSLPITQFTVHETSYRTFNIIYISLENDEIEGFKEDYEQYQKN